MVKRQPYILIPSRDQLKERKVPYIFSLMNLLPIQYTSPARLYEGYSVKLKRAPLGELREVIKTVVLQPSQHLVNIYHSFADVFQLIDLNCGHSESRVIAMFRKLFTIYESCHNFLRI